MNDARGSAYSYGNGDHGQVCLKIVGAARLAAGAPELAGWPSPQSGSHGGGAAWRAMGERRHGSNLDDFAMLAGSWATPREGDSVKGALKNPGPASKRVAQRVGFDLPTQASWATPAARDWRDGRASPETMERNARPLNEQAVQLAGWATPAAREAGGTPERFLQRKVDAVAAGKKLGVSLTSLSLQAATASGASATGSPAGTGNTGQLNPAHSRWLIGLPPAWDACAVTAMQSSRPLRRSSSER